MTAEQEIFLLNQTIKEIEEQKALLYIQDGFEKIQAVREKSEVETFTFFYIIQTLKDNTTTKLIMVESDKLQRPEKLRNLLPTYDISHLCNGKVFVNSLNISPLESIHITKDMTFDEFVQSFVTSDYSNLYIRNKLEEKLSAKHQTKQAKI